MTSLKEEILAEQISDGAGPPLQPATIEGPQFDSGAVNPIGPNRLQSKTLKAALGYIDAGWHVIPLKRSKKEPARSGWQKNPLNVDDAIGLFGGDGHGIGIGLGELSDGLIDVDLDWPEARRIADELLSEFPAFGRSSAPRSHRLAICRDGASRKFILPNSMKDFSGVPDDHALCVAEIRYTGQTMFPGSIHPSCERVEWDLSCPSTLPKMTLADLDERVGLVAGLAVVLRFYPAKGSRDDAAMALSGTLLNAPSIRERDDRVEFVNTLVQMIAKLAGDEEATHRGKAALTWEKMENGDPVVELPRLVELLGLPKDAIATLRGWLGQPDIKTNDSVVSEHDHLSRARTFVGKLRPNLRHYRDDYVDYHDGRYELVSDSTIKSDIYIFLDGCGKIASRDKQPTVVPFQPSTKSVNETIAALNADCHVLPTIEQPCWLDGHGGPDPADIISFPNGILDLRTGILLPPSAMLFTPHAIGFPYDPQASEPIQWKQFLNAIFDADQDQIDALQEAFGYFLSSDVSHEKAFMLLGPKRSGKDTSRHVLQSLLPAGAICGPTLDSMGSNFGMSQFIGKQLAVVGDMRLGSKCDKDLLAENVLKLTGRGLFTIDRKHKEHWTGQLPCKLLLISNEMPRIKDTSGALASRFIIFSTRQSFYDREDPNLFRDKLRPELPGVLLWALEGLRRMRERGPLAEPENSKAERLQLARDGSPVLAFVDECLTLQPDAVVTKDELHDAYLDYAVANGLYPMAKNAFMRALEAATGGKVKPGRRQEDGERTPIVQGALITFRPPKRRGSFDPNGAPGADLPF